LINLNEKQLIMRTQHGDSEAFNPLVVKYQPPIYNHIHGRVKNTETAKDLAQETWLKAFRSINTFRGASAFSSWLYRIAENVCIDFFRKQKHDTEPLHTVDECRIIDTLPCPSRDILRQELREHLRVAIQQLTPLRKQVFLLYYHQGLPIKNIAIRLKRSEGTIKSHLRNARLQLREHLTPFFV
jgi:RNA polymerase sigma-70 factor (ECF subfamily)